MNEVNQQWRHPPEQPPGASCSCTSCCPTGCRPHGVKVYDTPKKKVNKSGKSGKYINHLKPLIVKHDTFQGTKAELFDSWGLYDPYKGIGIAVETTHAFNPWRVPYNASLGDEAYRRAMNYQEKECLERALNSLQKEGSPAEGPRVPPGLFQYRRRVHPDLPCLPELHQCHGDPKGGPLCG